MGYTVKKFEVLSSDKIHNLNSVAYVPQGEIKGIFHLVHGMTEYIDRYAPLMAEIAECGFICCGYDNLGHGKTAKGDHELGFIAEKDGYKLLINDVKIFADFMKKEYPYETYILMGHSMGSFISRLAAAKYKSDFSRLIICGTAGPNPLADAGLFLSRFIGVFKGKKGYSSFLENLVFGAYNKRFTGSTKYEWLTNDRQIIDNYIKDKYCTFRFTLSAMHDLIKLNSLCNKSAWFKEMPKDLPIFIIAGEDDPVGNYGKGVKTVYEKLKAAEMQNVTLKLYKGCRHEIHNDNCKKEMAEDIINFIN